jgi:hypothetical protein
MKGVLLLIRSGNEFDITTAQEKISATVFVHTRTETVMVSVRKKIFIQKSG